MFCGRALPELVEKLSAVAGVYRWCHAPRWLRLMSACARIPLPSTEHILGFSGHSWAAPKSCQTRHGASGAYGGAQGTWEERLASFAAHQIRSDPSPVYGGGARAALDAFQRLGLPALLAHVRSAGAFPGA